MRFVHQLWASMLREWRLILRDIHGLAILFLMPLGFVVIMSLALQDFFGEGATSRFSLVVVDDDGGEAAQRIIEGLEKLSLFDIERRAGALPESGHARHREQAIAQARAGQRHFVLLLPPRMSARLGQALASGDPQQVMNVRAEDRVQIGFLADPAIRSDARLLARSAIERIIFSTEMTSVYSGFTGNVLDPDRQRGLFQITDAPSDAAGTATAFPRPTSTQQNVPAYALLAMFMMVVPLSGTFIRERTQGSLARLRAMPVPGSVVIAGKVLPYVAINGLQMALCLAIGRWLLPLLGAPALDAGTEPAAVATLTAASSLAAISFSLMVAMFARTIEQATAFGAASVLVLAALGGVMVPRLLMPSSLQSVAGWSPLGWALDGFLDLFVRGAGLAGIAPNALALLAFAAACLAIAVWRYGSAGRVHSPAN